MSLATCQHGGAGAVRVGADGHEGGDPKLAVDEEVQVGSPWGETSNDAGHQVANDDEVADGDAEALDGDGGIEYDGEVGVCELR